MDLQKCYFCGAEAPEVNEIEVDEKTVLPSGNLEGVRGTYRVECKSCGAKIEHDDLDQLISMWNYVYREE